MPLVAGLLCQPGYAAFINGRGCQPCPGGTFSKLGAACEWAPPGFFVPSVGASTYLPCESAVLSGAVICSGGTDTVPDNFEARSSDVNPYLKFGEVPLGYIRVPHLATTMVYLCEKGYTTVATGNSTEDDACVPCKSIGARTSVDIDSFLCSDVSHKRTHSQSVSLQSN
jgi:hypothetical protein